MFGGGSLKRKSWEGSGSAGLILTVHSAPHRTHVRVSVDHVIRIRDAKCLLGFGYEVCITHAVFMCERFGSQLLDKLLRGDWIMRALTSPMGQSIDGFMVW